MGYCPKCGAKIKYKRKSTGRRHCRRHGPIEQRFVEKHSLMSSTFPQISVGPVDKPPYNNDSTGDTHANSL